MSQVKNQNGQTIPRMSFHYHFVWWLIDTAATVFLGGALWLHGRSNVNVTSDLPWYFIAFCLLYLLYGGLSNVLKVGIWSLRHATKDNEANEKQVV